ncbi:hypothetical protein Trydic_g2181 [Trypoxylus dichotomus]
MRSEMSLTNNRNSTRARFGPCGTPDVTTLAAEPKPLCAKKPPTTKTDKNQFKIDKLIQEGHRLKIRQVALLTAVHESSIDETVSELGYRKVSVKWVLTLLIDQHKVQPTVAAIELLMHYRYENRFLLPLVTRDETWVHHHNPESKKDCIT